MIGPVINGFVLGIDTYTRFDSVVVFEKSSFSDNPRECDSVGRKEPYRECAQ